MDASVSRIRMHSDPDFCLVIDGDSYVEGSKIQVWKCNEMNPNQLWYASLRSPMAAAQRQSMCLLADGKQNGAAAHLGPCGSESWLHVVHRGGKSYAVPNEDAACGEGWKPVEATKEACVAAAEALRPGQGCWAYRGQRSWTEPGQREIEHHRAIYNQ